MNAIQPAAYARAVTGFQDSKAGTGGIVSCAWNRSLLWLLVRFLPLVILICLSITPAHADGVSGSITNGQTVNGALTRTGVDTYTFKVISESAFVVSLSQVGPHDEAFLPGITLIGPGSSEIRFRARPLFTILRQESAAEGTWSVKVDQKGPDATTGSYALTLVQIPSTIPVSSGIAGGALSPGVASSDTNSRGKIDIWTFNGVIGRTETLTLNQTGGNGFVPEIAVVSPTGDAVGGTSCDTGCTLDVPITKGGTYTVVALKHDDNDVTGTYSLSVNDKTN
jgi:hypothetical protein